jgi:hypothetical protein
MEIYKKSMGVFLSKIDNEFTLLKNEEVYILNEEGARILDLCNGVNDVSNIVKKLSNFYQISEKEIEYDIKGYIKELENNDLIKVIKIRA